MRIASVKSDLYTGAGWAVAAIVNNEVIAFEFIEHPDTSDVKAACDRVYGLPIVVAAAERDDAEYEAAQTADDPEAAEAAWSEKYALVVRGGMMSAGEFNFCFSKRERSAIVTDSGVGIKNEWF